MSSVYCSYCHKLVWDKDTGFSKDSKDSFCGNCKSNPNDLYDLKSEKDIQNNILDYLAVSYDYKIDDLEKLDLPINELKKIVLFNSDFVIKLNFLQKIPMILNFNKKNGFVNAKRIFLDLANKKQIEINWEIKKNV